MNKLFLSVLALCLLALANAQDEPVEPERPNIAEVITNLIGDVSALPEWFQQIIAKKLEHLQNHKDGDGEEPRRRGPPHRGGHPKKAGGLLKLDEDDLEGIEVPEWFTEFREQLKSLKRGPSGESEDVTFSDDVPESFRTWFTGFRARVKEMKEDRQEKHQQKRTETMTNLIGDISAFPEWFQELVAKKLEKVGSQEEDDKPRRGGPPPRRGGKWGHPKKGGKFFELDDEDIEGVDIPEWFTEFLDQMKSRKRGPPSEREEITFADDVPEWFQTWFPEFHARIHELKEKRQEKRPERPKTKGFPGGRGGKPKFGRRRFLGR